MKCVVLLSIGLLAMLIGEPAAAADLTGFLVKAPPVGDSWSWGGLYLGGHIGVARGTSHVTEPDDFDPASFPSIFGNNVATPGFIGGAQAGYNWQFGAWVLGVEGDFSLADMRGTNTCFAFSGMFVSSNCAAKTDWFSTVTGRIGQALGPDGHTLVYGKGGVAFAHNQLDVSVNNQFIGGGIAPPSTIQSSATQTGWTVGVGVEQALTPAWSVKVEYDYLNFGKFSIVNPPSAIVIPTGPNTALVGLSPPTATSADQNVHMMKLGLNYKWGADPFATWGPASGVMPVKAAPMVANGWSFEVGGRYWYSSGKFQKDFPATTTSSTSLVSRLTYDGVTGNSGEIFGRIDSPWGPFVKGFVGAGRTNGGQMNDEDWGLGPPDTLVLTSYSNTLSGLINNNMRYATIDVGHSFLRGADYKIGAFVGYNYYYERMQTNDCTQIASPASGICSPAIAGTPVITETDKWNSLRVGGNAEVMLLNSLKVTADVAYLPYVKFSGVDNHWLRDLTIDGAGSRGRGVQAELILSYYFTPQFSVGAGARYWAMWATNGTDAFNGAPTNRTDTYRMERYGTLLQAKYQFAPP